MEHNPYAVTETVLSSEAPAPDETAWPYYVVSPAKCVSLWIATFGFYGLYWFHRNWDLERVRTGEKIRPSARAIFSIFFTHSLFSRVDARLRALGREHSWSPNGTASLVVGLSVVGAVYERLSGDEWETAFDFAISFGFTAAAAIALIPAQRAVNAASGDPDGASNSRLTPANWLWLLGGGLVWLLALVGIVATELGLYLGE